MKALAFCLTLFATSEPSGDWADLLKTASIGAIFSYYLFIHEPRQRAAEHKRRMDEIEALMRKDQK